MRRYSRADPDRRDCSCISVWGDGREERTNCRAGRRYGCSLCRGGTPCPGIPSSSYAQDNSQQLKNRQFLVAKATQAFTAISNSVSKSHILCPTPSANQNKSSQFYTPSIYTSPLLIQYKLKYLIKPFKPFFRNCWPLSGLIMKKTVDVEGGEHTLPPSRAIVTVALPTCLYPCSLKNCGRLLKFPACFLQ